MTLILKKSKLSLYRNENKKNQLREPKEDKPTSIDTKFIFENKDKQNQLIVSQIFSFLDRNINCQKLKINLFWQTFGLYELDDSVVQPVLKNLNELKNKKHQKILTFSEANDLKVSQTPFSNKSNLKTSHSNFQYNNQSIKNLSEFVKQAVDKKISYIAKSLENNKISPTSSVSAKYFDSVQMNKVKIRRHFVELYKQFNIKELESLYQSEIKDHRAVFRDWLKDKQYCDVNEKYFIKILKEAIDKKAKQSNRVGEKNKNQYIGKNLSLKLLLALALNKIDLSIYNKKRNKHYFLDDELTSDSLIEIQKKEAFILQFLTPVGFCNRAISSLCEIEENNAMDVIGTKSLISDLFEESDNYKKSLQELNNTIDNKRVSENLKTLFSEKFINELNDHNQKFFIQYLKQIPANIRHKLLHFKKEVDKSIDVIKQPLNLFDWNNERWEPANGKYLNQDEAEKFIRLAETEYQTSYQFANQQIFESLNSVNFTHYFSLENREKLKPYLSYSFELSEVLKPSFSKIWKRWINLSNQKKFNTPPPFGVSGQVFSKEANNENLQDENSKHHRAVKRVFQLIYKTIRFEDKYQNDLKGFYDAVIQTCKQKDKRIRKDEHKEQSFNNELLEIANNEKGKSNPKSIKDFFSFLAILQAQKAKSNQKNNLEDNNVILFIQELYLRALIQEIQSLNVVSQYRVSDDKFVLKTVEFNKLDDKKECNFYLFIHLIPPRMLSDMKNQMIKASQWFKSDDMKKMIEIIDLHNQTLSYKTAQAYQNIQGLKNLGKVGIELEDENNIQLSRQLKALYQFGNNLELKIAKVYQENIKLSDEKKTIPNQTIEQTQQRKNELHQKFVLNSRKEYPLSKEEREEYRELVKKIDQYNHIKNKKSGFYLVLMNNLVIEILSRLAGFMRKKERLFAFHYPDSDAGKVLKSIKEIQDIRNKIVHFNWLQDDSFSICDLILDARKIFSINNPKDISDRKFRNTITHSIAKIFDKYGMDLKISIQPKQGSVNMGEEINIELSSKQNTHLKKFKQELKFNNYPDEFINTIKQLLLYKQ